MSDKPISVGDLVMVVRPTPCGCSAGLGKIFKVTIIDRSPLPNKCASCGQLFGPHDQARNRSERLGAALYRLKRLDPDALKDDVPTKEELTA